MMPAEGNGGISMGGRSSGSPRAANAVVSSGPAESGDGFGFALVDDGQEEMLGDGGDSAPPLAARQPAGFVRLDSWLCLPEAGAGRQVEEARGHALQIGAKRQPVRHPRPARKDMDRRLLGLIIDALCRARQVRCGLCLRSISSTCDLSVSAMRAFMGQSVPVTKPRRLWPAIGILWGNLVMGIVITCAGAGTLAAGLADSPVGVAVAVTGAIILVLGLGLTALFLRLGVRPVVLTETTLIRSRPFEPRELALADICGVGLVCQPSGRAGGWWLRLWVGDGEETSIGAFRAGLAPWRDQSTGRRRLFQYFGDYVPPADDSERLSHTKAARVAKVIYEQVLAAQGLNGLLATRQRQREIPLSRFHTPERTGVWGPDGTFRVAE